jgi:hypothetical protein
MATREAIAIMEDQAFAQLSGAINHLALLAGIDPVNVKAIQFSDPDYQRAAQWSALAGWLGQAVGLLIVPSADQAAVQPDPDLSKMTRAELRSYAEAHGIDGAQNLSKADLLALLNPAKD